MNPNIDIWNFELIQTYVSFYRNAKNNFPTKYFLSIGTMLKETYINIAKSQHENLDNSNLLLYTHWFRSIVIWNLSMLHKLKF